MLYAGVGARNTPPAILEVMTKMAQWLAQKGWSLRSGGARGADTAFMTGHPSDQQEIFLPKHLGWGQNREDAMDLAEQCHPQWSWCSQFVRELHARNALVVLGPNLQNPAPVDALVCWTPGGKVTGGTGVAIRMAGTLGIPVFNLAITPPRDICIALRDLKRSTM